MKQTAVEWFSERIQSNIIFNFENVLKKALEMEKQQIIDAWLSAWKDSFLEPLEDKYYQPEAEQYYNETFNEK
jgi:hypothetical protein